jgi:NTP pyrophosphatase (non-canonical NTP hydrolase)
MRNHVTGESPMTTYKEFREAVIDMEKARNFSHELIEIKVDCAVKEVYELVEAVNGDGNILEELGDSVNSLEMVANRLGVNLLEVGIMKAKKDLERV